MLTFLKNRVRRPSVLFLHHNYYHFKYLAKALRDRGWDALCVSVEDPNSSQSAFYHGEDLSLFDSDPYRFIQNIEDFFAYAKNRYSLMHFSGDGHLSFFPSQWNQDEPSDILEWKKAGNKVAYTISGCNSATPQSLVAKWSAMDGDPVVCDRCVWQLQPEVCNDAKSAAWGRKVQRYCDAIFAETLPAMGYLDGPNTVFEPVTMALDPDFWNPDLEIPTDHLVEREEGEILVFHGVGNFDSRSQGGRNIKGTPAVVAAVDRLRGEGVPIRLMFVTGRPSWEMRFVQAQADIVVDQLNFGRYGAIAREAMMLGKPTICYLNREEPKAGHQLQSLQEVPLVSATEATLYAALKELALDPQWRLELGRRSREFAVKWHGAPGCAERYEAFYQTLFSTEEVREPLPSQRVFPPTVALGDRILALRLASFRLHQRRLDALRRIDRKLRSYRLIRRLLDL